MTRNGKFLLGGFTFYKKKIELIKRGMNNLFILMRDLKPDYWFVSHSPAVMPRRN